MLAFNRLLKISEILYYMGMQSIFEVLTVSRHNHTTSAEEHPAPGRGTGGLTNRPHTWTRTFSVRIFSHLFMKHVFPRLVRPTAPRAKGAPFVLLL